ncbi:hypothetical protein [Streptomyces sp. SID3343]|uniref:hypothetical protein n=1 Tax=Streptomyces sp. SID3343 TaxID=2690260 RepID=UPI0013C1B08F|nr:hypothetical protein [Streptomyces sp. SID3343]MYW03287.1 hypothetical protein [Streptomyces sp. SID3343]
MSRQEPGDRALPAGARGLPPHPRRLERGRRPLRAREVCEALDHELLPKNIESSRAKLKRLVKLDIFTEIDAGSCTR